MPAHTIAYAYPTSPAAEKHGFAKTGCYTVAIDGTEKATSTFAQAQGMASQLGSTPDRWSLDHPQNDHMNGVEKSKCQACSSLVESIIGCPTGEEICQACIDTGMH